jgi:lysozyme
MSPEMMAEFPVIIASLKDQLIRDEELRLHPYKDSGGKLTIGVGRNLDDVGISQEEAELLLANDINAATVALEANFSWAMGLDDVRKAALLNMTFNMGVRGLGQFKDFLAKMQAKDFRAAAGAMLDSLWARQVGNRATRLSIQIESGFWQ